jgi:NADPH:quinone reductase
MTQRIVIRSPGGPEVLEVLVEGTPLAPGAGQVRVRAAAIGVNFIDIYHRIGRYPLPLPFTPGVEAAGIVEAVGEGVTTIAVGDRVAGFLGSGGYAQHIIAAAERWVPIPAAVSDDQAAAVLLQGMTAHFLCHDTFAIAAGHTALVHAAAGGVGLLLTQMIKRRGGRVIATVSTEEKAALARAAGADEVIRYTEQDVVAETKRLSAGRGVDVVYDSVGKTTFAASLASLRPRGMMVLFGAASGPAPMVDPLDLMRGSHFLTRPTLMHYVAEPGALRARAAAVFAAVAAGELQVRMAHRYALVEAGRAHEELESRRTTGKVLLLP